MWLQVPYLSIQVLDLKAQARPLPKWSDPRIKFVLVIHKHLFVFVCVIQFLCGPKIIMFACTKVVHDSERLCNHPHLYISSLGSYLHVKYVSSGMMNEWKSNFGAVGGWTNVCIPFLIRLLNA